MAAERSEWGNSHDARAAIDTTTSLVRTSTVPKYMHDRSLCASVSKEPAGLTNASPMVSVPAMVGADRWHELVHPTIDLFKRLAQKSLAVVHVLFERSH
jgi:hypothetical protein